MELEDEVVNEEYGIKWESNKSSREFEEMEESRMMKRMGKGMHMEECMRKEMHAEKEFTGKGMYGKRNSWRK